MIVPLLVLIAVYSCKKKEQDPFAISKNRIGLLTSTTPVKALDSIYALDSIVRLEANDKGIRTSNEIEIYSKRGTKLLILEPRAGIAADVTIKRIQLVDPRFKTETGFSVASTFAEVKAQYPISKINNTLSTAVIFIDSIGAYFTIDKEELPDEFKYSADAKIELDRIPDAATIKHLWIQWEEE